MAKATLAQVRALEITERTTSILSLVGCSFIIITFLSSAAFHKPINRLVFYASLGNVITNIATLISVSGVAAGAAAPLCQMQAFIIQMYVLSPDFAIHPPLSKRSLPPYFPSRSPSSVI